MPDGRIRTAESEGNSATPRPITIREDSLSDCAMKCNPKGFRWAGYAVAALIALFSLSCQESLPTYVFPTNIMSLDVKTIEQLSNRIARPGHQLVHMVLIGKNTFDEVFEDSVDI